MNNKNAQTISEIRDILTKSRKVRFLITAKVKALTKNTSITDPLPEDILPQAIKKIPNVKNTKIKQGNYCFDLLFDYKDKPCIIHCESGSCGGCKVVKEFIKAPVDYLLNRTTLGNFEVV